MNSCIYEGQVRHFRYQPVRHLLSYRVFMVYLDLDELGRVFQGRWFWSTRGFNLAQFRREDHAGDPGLTLREAIERLVRERTGRTPRGPICLLTHLRYFGYCFNPVSFYYCFEPDGKKLEAVVAEVSNTPWNQKHCYVLSEEIGNAPRVEGRFRKAFHVSPFMPMDMEYGWRLSRPESTLAVHMENVRGGEKVFEATLSLKRREISASSLNRALLRYPMMTLQVIAAIYWNAVKLWAKGCPTFSHPLRRDKKANL